MERKSVKKNEKEELQEQEEKETQLWESQENQRRERWMEREISRRPIRHFLSLRPKTCWNWFPAYSSPITFGDNCQLWTGHWNQNTKQTFWYVEYQKCLSEVLGLPSSLSPDFWACYPPSGFIQLFQFLWANKLMGLQSAKEPSKSQ